MHALPQQWVLGAPDAVASVLQLSDQCVTPPRANPFPSNVLFYTPCLFSHIHSKDLLETTHAASLRMQASSEQAVPMWRKVMPALHR